MRYKVTLEYDGSRYRGWQVQQNARSVQGTLLTAASQLFQQSDVEIYGSGRTDAGVHALGQVAHLDVNARWQGGEIRDRLNEVLPADINILAVESVAPDFHARHHAVARSYIYQISRRRNAFGKPFVWWIKEPLNVKAMQAAAKVLEGFHDFQSFSNEKGKSKSSQVDVKQVSIHEQGDLLVVHLVASHFLWKMVRRTVGMLVEVGAGRLSKDQVKGFLETASPEPALFTAPPTGLFLERVYYPGETISTGFRTLL